jgi:integrase
MTDKLALPYLKRDADKHGKVRTYFRCPEFALVPLPDPEGSPEFMQIYSDCMAKMKMMRASKPKANGNRSETRHSFNELISAYYRSSSFKGVAESTKKTYRSSLEWFRVHHGKRFVEDAGFAALEAVISSRSTTPAAANKLIKRLRQIMKLAVKYGWIESNAATELEFYPTGEIHTWETAELEQFLNHWPHGSKARLALLLHFYTGQRRSDVVKMKWTDIANGKVSVVQFKTKQRLLIPIHKSLQHELTLCPWDSQQGTIIKTEFGKPFTRDGYGNWFRKACNKAGLPDRCSSHGLRKASAVALAHAGCSANEIMSITGHTSLSEVTRYTKEADQKRLSESAMSRLQSHGFDNSTHDDLSHANDNPMNTGTCERVGGPGGTRTPNQAVMSRRL